MATIKDVAKKAGVSIGTVSYVLNKKDLVRPETAARVIQAIEELNYRPNQAARTLVTKTTRAISVLITDISDPFFSPIVRGVEDIASKARYVVMVGNSDESHIKAKEYLEALASHNVDGLIISPTNNFDQLIETITELKIPIVQVNRRFDALTTDVVETDNILGGYLATKHLCSLGHTRIGIILGPTALSTYNERFHGYLKALQEEGIPIRKELICIGERVRFGFGFRQTKRLLNLAKRPTALFTGSGLISHGAYQAIREMGIKMPEELSFIAYGETQWTSLVNPAVTVVEQKTLKMGQLAGKLLIERLGGKDRAPQRIKIEPTLLVRGTTGPTAF